MLKDNKNAVYPKLKAVNIRDYQSNPKHRQVMGLFKMVAHKLDMTQAELLKQLYNSTLKEMAEVAKFTKGGK